MRVKLHVRLPRALRPGGTLTRNVALCLLLVLLVAFPATAPFETLTLAPIEHLASIIDATPKIKHSQDIAVVGLVPAVVTIVTAGAPGDGFRGDFVPTALREVQSFALRV